MAVRETNLLMLMVVIYRGKFGKKFKKPRPFGQFNDTKPNQKFTYPKCKICQGNHFTRQCKYSQGRCFGCGQEGHRYSECLNTK